MFLLSLQSKSQNNLNLTNFCREMHQNNYWLLSYNFNFQLKASQYRLPKSQNHFKFSMTFWQRQSNGLMRFLQLHSPWDLEIKLSGLGTTELKRISKQNFLTICWLQNNSRRQESSCIPIFLILLEVMNELITAQDMKWTFLSFYTASLESKFTQKRTSKELLSKFLTNT